MYALNTGSSKSSSELAALILATVFNPEKIREPAEKFLSQMILTWMGISFKVSDSSAFLEYHTWTSSCLMPFQILNPSFFLSFLASCWRAPTRKANVKLAYECFQSNVAFLFTIAIEEKYLIWDRSFLSVVLWRMLQENIFISTYPVSLTRGMLCICYKLEIQYKCEFF